MRCALVLCEQEPGARDLGSYLVLGVVIDSTRTPRTTGSSIALPHPSYTPQPQVPYNE